MVGSRAEKHHSSSVGKNWVMMGFCRGDRSVKRGETGGRDGWAGLQVPNTWKAGWGPKLGAVGTTSG